MAVIATRDAMRSSSGALRWIACVVASSLAAVWCAILWFLVPG